MREKKTFSSPFMRYAVIKYGGHAMVGGGASFSKQIVSLYQKNIAPIIVHGGGPEITQMLERLDIQSTFINGLRKTTSESLDVAQMVLCGLVNKRIAAEITSEGVPTIGLSGTDASLIEATAINQELGFVGHPLKINKDLLKTLLNAGIIPVIAPIGRDSAGQNYNINADTVAAIIAATLKTSLFILTDVAGVLDKNGIIQHHLNEAEIVKLYEAKIIRHGMYPKVKACLDALKAGAEEAIILDGRSPENLRKILISKETNIGTSIQIDERPIILHEGMEK
ncbi:acetylglutamate kinase [Acetobacteraceae bacterium]|nr:acetylglutamate kinase [Acetobacteraceae bacterium]